MKLNEFVNFDNYNITAKIATVVNKPKPNAHAPIPSTINEIWKIVDGTNQKYRISDYGTLESYKTGSWEKMNPTTTPAGYMMVSIQHENGVQRPRFIHHLVLESFNGLRNENEETRHLNGNPADNRLLNLVWGTTRENADDRVKHKQTTKNRIDFEDIINIELIGEEEVFDLEVESPFHNFLADGFVVHNSINEYSGRYSVIEDDMYMPDPEHMMPQALDNKQGRSSDELNDQNYKACWTAIEQTFEDSYATYKHLLGKDEDGNMSELPDILLQRKKFLEDAAIKGLWKMRDDAMARGEEMEITDEMISEKISEYMEHQGFATVTDDFAGIAKELARIVLPVAAYSQMYWKSDLRNIFNFISLRSDPHAQYEIRTYSDAMLELIRPIVPWACEAFEDYSLNASGLSAMELGVMKDIITSAFSDGDKAKLQHDIKVGLQERGCSTREVTEFVKKFDIPID
ncbi:MAG: hypothetical protein DRQ35_02460 [Gammaproteobacteria bacterium]|nr:MAG: hypothetical protein DRQ35_02460 [Gammaproteobacteria bacterium]